MPSTTPRNSETAASTAHSLPMDLCPTPPDERAPGRVCALHADLCAHTGEEADRCPWCHCPWSVILRRDLHSCETRDLWPSRERSWRVKRARAMRAKVEADLCGASA